jgi:hypothetical protein
MRIMRMLVMRHAERKGHCIAPGPNPATRRPVVEIGPYRHPIAHSLIARQIVYTHSLPS